MKGRYNIRTRPEIGEWQTDNYGRRYRMIGNIKEYEPTIRIDGMEVPESQLEAFHKARAAAKEKELERKKQKAVSNTVKLCPFKTGLNTNCTADCAFRAGANCVLYRPATQDTAGAYCPLGMQCRTDCALYQGGCGLVETIKKLT